MVRWDPWAEKPPCRAHSSTKDKQPNLDKGDRRGAWCASPFGRGSNRSPKQALCALVRAIPWDSWAARPSSRGMRLNGVGRSHGGNQPTGDFILQNVPGSMWC